MLSFNKMLEIIIIALLGMFYLFWQVAPPFDRIRPGADHPTKMHVRFALIGALIVAPLFVIAFVSIIESSRENYSTAVTWFFGILAPVIWGLVEYRMRKDTDAARRREIEEHFNDDLWG